VIIRSHPYSARCNPCANSFVRNLCLDKRVLSWRYVGARREEQAVAHAIEIRSAIERTDGGSYGICLECEENVAPKRLLAIPWAELCISCQQRADASEIAREAHSAFDDLYEAA
jgi:hypothetical protein